MNVEIQMREMIEEARKQFRARCRKVLREAYEDADRLSTAVGEVSLDEAYEAWVKNVLVIVRREES